MIITIKTDAAEAEIGLLDVDGQVIKAERWESGRRLSGELLGHLKELVIKAGKSWADLTGVVVFSGPGSFTGLRIGVTVANAIAYAQNIPIVGTRGEHWQRDGVELLAKGTNQTQVVPHYGAEPNITKPRTSA